jgi:Ca-activated chloride channel family protein
MMTWLAERGGGMYGYLQDAAALEELLGREVDNGRRAVARNVELELEGSDFFEGVEVPGRHVEWSPRGRSLHLADLRPGLPTRVLMRLRSRPTPEGGTRRLSTTVRARLPGGEVQAVTAAMALPALDDVDAVLVTRDEAVFSRGVSAVGSARMVLAAAAYERGDDGAARSLLDEAKGLFGMSADALAGEAEVESVRGSFSKADATGRKDLARGLERKKLMSFGRENEGY